MPKRSPHETGDGPKAAKSTLQTNKPADIKHGKPGKKLKSTEPEPAKGPHEMPTLAQSERPRKRAKRIASADESSGPDPYPATASAQNLDLKLSEPEQDDDRYLATESPEHVSAHVKVKHWFELAAAFLEDNAMVVLSDFRTA